MAPSRIDALPLFPLQTVLFPGGWLTLRIFEVRYLDMIGRCHREGRPFGVISLTEGHEVQQPAGPHGEGYANEAFHDVGTLAAIESLERPQPGLMVIACRGSRRFRLHGRERLKHGLWVGQAALLDEDAAFEVPEDLEPIALTLQAVLRELDANSVAGDPRAMPPRHFDDCGWVANRWCELLPLAAPVKQRLLETESPLLRLELVADHLERLQKRP